MPHASRVCPVVGCPVLTTGGRCATHRRQVDRARGSRQARGYDRDHELLRKQWAPRVATGTVACARCSRTIRAGQAWHLDHKNDRTGYLGPSHDSCNLSAAGKAAHR